MQLYPLQQSYFSLQEELFGKLQSCSLFSQQKVQGKGWQQADTDTIWLPVYQYHNVVSQTTLVRSIWLKRLNTDQLCNTDERIVHISLPDRCILDAQWGISTSVALPIYHSRIRGVLREMIEGRLHFYRVHSRPHSPLPLHIPDMTSISRRWYSVNSHSSPSATTLLQSFGTQSVIEAQLVKTCRKCLKMFSIKSAMSAL